MNRPGTSLISPTATVPGTSRCTEPRRRPGEGMQNTGDDSVRYIEPGESESRADSRATTRGVRCTGRSFQNRGVTGSGVELYGRESEASLRIAAGRP